MIAARAGWARRNCIGCALGLPHRRTVKPPRPVARTARAIARFGRQPNALAALATLAVMVGAVTAISVYPDSTIVHWMAGIGFGAALGWCFTRSIYRSPGRPA